MGTLDDNLFQSPNEKSIEMNSPIAFSPGAQSPSGIQSPLPDVHHHPHIHHAKESIRRHLVHPDGRRIQIAHTPEEHFKLQNQLREQGRNAEFDVVLSGSPEHLAVVRELHAHHSARRDTLRDTHGEVYHEFERVRDDLDHLSNELNHLTHHGVEMDANFSKYGYTARIRTKDEDSGSATPTSTAGSDHALLDKQQSRITDGVKFFKRPLIRQYFHKGLLWRSARSGEVGTFELFADLLYVGIIGIIGNKASENPTGKSFLLYAINFTMAFKIWNDLTLVTNWFERDDVVQKLTVMLYLILLFGYTTNISYAFEDNHPGGLYDTYYPMMSLYLAERFYGVMYFTWLSYVVPLVRGALLFSACIILLAIVFWLSSIHVNYPGQLPLIWIAIVIDIWGQGCGMFLSRASDRWSRSPAEHTSRWERFVRKNFEFYPAINIEHRIERTNAFVSLVFGYSVLNILYQSRASVGLNAFLGKGILGLMQAFAFQWLYFDIDHHCVHIHAIRRHWLSTTVWITCHLPFVLSYTLAAATLSKLVIAHDCFNSNIEDLGETYQLKSVANLTQGLRWCYCGGIASSLMTMTLLSICHVHKKIQNPRLARGPCLVIRTCIALTILLLPLAKDQLSSLSLIGTTTALVCLALAGDIFGASSRGDRFWSGGWCDESKRATQYEAKISCSKKKKQEIIKALHRGETIRLEELLRRRGTNASAMSSSTDVGLSEKRAVNGDEEWANAAL